MEKVGHCFQANEWIQTNVESVWIRLLFSFFFHLHFVQHPLQSNYNQQGIEEVTEGECWTKWRWRKKKEDHRRWKKSRQSIRLDVRFTFRLIRPNLRLEGEPDVGSSSFTFGDLLPTFGWWLAVGTSSVNSFQGWLSWNPTFGWTWNEFTNRQPPPSNLRLEVRRIKIWTSSVLAVELVDDEEVWTSSTNGRSSSTHRQYRSWFTDLWSETDEGWVCSGRSGWSLELFLFLFFSNLWLGYDQD